MTFKKIIGLIAFLCLGSIQAQACTNISIENVSGSFVTSQKTGMIPFKIKVFCANAETADTTTRITHSSANSQGAEFSLYKDGVFTKEETKVLKMQILDRTFREFSTQSLLFNAGQSNKEIDLYLSIPNFKQNEPGSYNGVINFDVEY